jgi:hypothetical protein
MYFRLSPSTKSGNLLVTGSYRSGTTLLEKLLHHHPSLCVGSQPFPVLYFLVKEAFDKEKSLKPRYPLDHLFLKKSYSREEFNFFLENHLFDESFLDRIFKSLQDYPGFWTPQLLNFRENIRAGTFFDIYEQLNQCMAHIYPKNNLQYLGAKEILLEEYIPFLLSKGIRVLLSLRDPRDMVTSLNFRDRDIQTGLDRPVLYSLRIWRKSVALALEFEGHENFFWVKYEDVVLKTIAVLNQIAEMLKITPFKKAFFKDGIRNQDGFPWKGNSSFADFSSVNSQSIGRFKNLLSSSVIRYTESVCFPEMIRLGYPFYLTESFDESAIRDFTIPFKVIHEKFPKDYSVSEEHVTEEIERYRKLKNPQGLSKKEKQIWFVSEKAYRKLTFIN